MSTLADLTQRCQFLLQDPQEYAWAAAQIRTELDHAIWRLARRHWCQDLLWVQAVAQQSFYPLNAQSLFLLRGTDTSGTTGNVFTLTDSTQNFTATIAPGDRVRNLQDGSTGRVTTVASTVLTCAAGFEGGIDHAVDTGDAYVVERPLDQTCLVSIDAVLYNGKELWYAGARELDQLAPGWEQQRTGPKYWSVDQSETPLMVHIHPPPLVTGSSVPVFPQGPLGQRYEENLVCVVSHHPQGSRDALETVHLLAVEQDLVVFDAVRRLASFEGEFQALPLANTMTALHSVWLSRLGGR